MKLIIISSILSLVMPVACMAGEEVRSEWSQTRLAEIEKMSDPPTAEDIYHLSLMAGAFVRNGEDTIQTLARKKILGTPNFDKKLREYLEAEREKWKKSPSYDLYDMVRSNLFKSIGVIQDPRVVRFLGGLLSDVEFTEDLEELGRINADWSPIPANAILAARELRKLVNDFPSDGTYVSDLDKRIIPWLEWYEEVKAGKRSFSFKGQNTEYRFNPDGTWMAVPAPDSHQTPSATKAK